MASFNSLPTELLHSIAKHLAPRRYEDTKNDILAFRLIKRQTWLVANRYAFKYMTLHVQDPAAQSKLGHFGQEVLKDASGFDARCSVKEVRFTLDPMIVAPEMTLASDSMDYTWRTRDKWFRKHAQDIFIKALGKNEGEELNEEEKMLNGHYWKLCVEPYLPQQCRHAEYHGYEKQRLETRIQEDLAHFSNVQTISIDLESHVLDKRNESYRILAKKGLIDHFWNEKNQELVSFFRRNPENHDLCGGTMHSMPMGNSWGRIIVYDDFRTQGWNLFHVLPRSVTKIIWRGDHMGRAGWELYGNSISEIKLAQIIEMELTCNPMGRSPTSYAKDFALPNLLSLTLDSGITPKTPNKKRITSYINPIHCNFLSPILPFISAAPRLKNLYVRDYAVSSVGWEHILTYVYSRNVNIVLSDMIFYKELAPIDPSTDPYEGVAEKLSFRWLDLVVYTRDKILGLVEFGLVSLKGTFRTIHHRPTPQVVWEQTLSEAVVGMLERYLRTGVGECEIRKKLSSEECRSVVNDVGDLRRQGFWSHDR